MENNKDSQPIPEKKPTFKEKVKEKLANFIDILAYFTDPNNRNN